MPVYNKKGLDYFALSINHYDHLKMKRLRRLCHANGLAVYTLMLCQLYGGKGYYLTVTDELVEDIAEDLALTPEKVTAIVDTCCRLGIFDTDIYHRDRVLTSADIQMSYVDICSRTRRRFSLMDVKYLLLSDSDIRQVAGVKKIEKEVFELKIWFRPSPEEPMLPPEQSSQKKRNEKKEKETKENILPPTPSSDSEEGSSEAEGGHTLRPVSPAGGADGRDGAKEAKGTILPDPHTPCPRGEGRNYQGLVDNLMKYRLEVADINAILRLSNFGEVGDPVWQAVYDINNAGGRIKQPAKYIYSVINKNRKP